MPGRPILQTSFEYHMWKALDSRTFSKGGPASLVHELESQSGTVNSSVLVMLIDELEKSRMADRDTLLKVVSHSRVVDCLPAVRASLILLGKNDVEGAEEAISIPGTADHNASLALAKAKVLQAKGDIAGAKEAAIRAYGSDPSVREVYSLLNELEPTGGWLQRANIQDVVEGVAPTYPAGAGRLQELYAIYNDWYSGRRDKATERMITSKWYQEKDPEFLLLSARTSVDERDWRSASMVYNGLMGPDSYRFITVEAAEVALRSGDVSRALELLTEADSDSYRVQRDIIRARFITGETVEMMDAIRALLDNEVSGSEEYLALTNFLLTQGMDNEAKVLLERYSAFVGDDSGTLTMRSGMHMRSGNYPTARRLATKAVRLDKNDNAARAQLARVLHMMGKDETAEQECSGILHLAPHDIDALQLMLEIKMSRQDYKGAIGAARTILDEDPGNVATMVVLGRAMGLSGDSTGASDMFRMALRSDSTKAGGISVISAMLECGLHKAAESACDSMERQFPNDAMVKRLRGNAQYAVGEYLKASSTYAAAVALEPNNPVLWHSRGMSDEARGDYESAEYAYNRAVLLDQSEPEYWISKSVIQEKIGDRFRAVESLNRAIELDPRSKYALVRKSVILSAAGRNRDALFHIQQAFVVDPHDDRILCMMADLMVTTGDASGAFKVLRERLSKEFDELIAVKIHRLMISTGDPRASEFLESQIHEHPDAQMLASERKGEHVVQVVPEIEEEPEPEVPKDDPSELHSMSVSLMVAGDLKGAMRAIDRALRVDPDHPDLHLQKARVALAMGDFEGSAFLSSNALKIHPEHAGLHQALAEAREAKGDAKGALAEADIAIGKGCEESSIFELKGRVLEILGESSRARASYGRAVALNQSNIDALESMGRLELDAGDMKAATATFARVLKAEPGRMTAMVLSAEASAGIGDEHGILAAYDMLRRCDDIPDDLKARMVTVLESHGFNEESRILIAGIKPQSFDNSVKRYAEKALRRAYTTRTSHNDPDILDALGLEDDMAKQVSSYLAELPDIGPIMSDGADYSQLEKESYDIIMKISWTDLEGSPVLPLEKVFIDGRYRDADSAKRMVAYIQRTMASKPGTPNEKLSSIAMGLPKGMTVYEVMRQCGLGVHDAVTVKSLIL